MKFERHLSRPHTIFLQSSPGSSPGRQVSISWSAVGKAIVKLLVGSAEPIVEQRCNSEGHTYYTIYDPVNQRQVGGLSETEARAWLEQRYYQ